ncbi:uncharacterized protein MKZ38_009623 [Zalerion maritima]|uniref:Uncharacterized protein n=1 Tax=Zalerion maritima TaxID=339359 RepID=A0AAD5WUY2_9PEZI|nr:uncharacterized protein MKZ38_009623 [Zalerion maritima]
MASILDIQRDIILDKIKSITSGDWKVLVLDEHTKKLIYNVVKEDDILNKNIVNIEMVEQKREMNPDMDAVYILHPQDHIADCVVEDIRRRRYKDMILVWISPPGEVLDKIRSTGARIRNENMPLDFFPRESNLVTFREKKSFLQLYHPALDRRVPDHLSTLARRIAAVCISLNECPMVRYYCPKKTHDAAVLSYHLGRFVDDELAKYRKSRRDDWPPPSNRPPGLLVVTDRAMDLNAPLLHEFTYQAMAHDVLRLKDDEKVTFHMKINEGRVDEEKKDVEITDEDKVWVDIRHRHMKDTIDKLMADFQKFLDANPHFQDQGDDAKTSLSAIRDMMGGLPEFQQMKEAYSLHLTMAQDCMNKFSANKLMELAAIEQTLATGLDEDLRKPRETLESVVQLLDDEVIHKQDRLRLILLWIMFRDGVIHEDVKRLLAHAELPIEEEQIVRSLECLGFHNKTDVKEQRPPKMPIFPPKTELLGENDSPLSRYETVLGALIDSLCRGTVDNALFPFSQGPLDDPSQDPMVQAGSGASLRAGGRAEPRWARAGRARPVDNRQRVMVYMAGGATYSEARDCYKQGQLHNKDVYLITSHMLSPRDYLQSLRQLGWTGARLDELTYVPRPPKPPVLSEPPPRQQPPPMQAGVGGPGGGRHGGMPPGPGMGGRAPPRPGGLPGRPVAPPTQSMERMNIGSNGGDGRQGSVSSVGSVPAAQQQQQRPSGEGHNHLQKDKDKKKKRWFK